MISIMTCSERMPNAVASMGTRAADPRNSCVMIEQPGPGRLTVCSTRTSAIARVSWAKQRLSMMTLCVSVIGPSNMARAPPSERLFTSE
jgi:hypothetical protein